MQALDTLNKKLDTLLRKFVALESENKRLKEVVAKQIKTEERSLVPVMPYHDLNLAIPNVQETLPDATDERIELTIKELADEEKAEERKKIARRQKQTGILKGVRELLVKNHGITDFSIDNGEILEFRVSENDVRSICCYSAGSGSA